ncbi:DUF2927 domain-containing protein [Sulfitobacter sabulilitoris]|uniref:DUF2927 domain-containing protein n=1 Tax=Sulfitobacter sabulilitoris TaxID=2562655 RepID=A0A5S3PJ69_9RHOB|nr:DUF2927 domain-containing protein [Sulfitobacter sabulilitoris]TMM54439.1 DUF2927 domain-containing protein [Sulfitobacter sabulilitoris]
MRGWVLPVVLLLSACAPATPGDQPTRANIADSSLPPMKTFAPRLQPAAAPSDTDLAQDFLDLSFALESGRVLPVFTRFEGPITLRVTGKPPASLGPDLMRLLGRLRAEAGVPVTVTTDPAAAITIEAVPRAAIRRVLPQAACFVAPNVSSLKDYRGARRSSRTNWALLRTRTRLAIFVPNDASAQEVRDCLHEELAQSIGPLNDLYRLPNSVFNDDNVHTVLTGYDMLILRMTYAPELRSGMTRAQVAARLPQILARLNPGGRYTQARLAGPTPRAWSDAIQIALGHGSSPDARRAAADRAISIARRAGWRDHRLGFSHYAKGRIVQQSDPGVALSQYELADRIYAASPDTRLHRAYVATHLAAFAIASGDGATALAHVDPFIDSAVASENAALLSTLMLLRAEALTLTGRDSEARRVRLDSLGWARYGFGPDWAVRAKMREIASLNPRSGPT